MIVKIKTVHLGGYTMNYWKEYYKKLDACQTTEEAEALKDDRYYAEEAKLYAEHGKSAPIRKRVILRSEFHRTETTVPVQSDGTVLADNIDMAGQQLCGMEDCQCHPIKLNGFCVVDVNGNCYEVS
jgi:hypothetical protein